MSADEDASVILTRIEANLDAHSRQLSGHIDADKEWKQVTSVSLQGLDTAIRGNNHTPGINVRLDRVEQREHARSKLTWGAIIAALSALAGVVRGWFTVKGS